MIYIILIVLFAFLTMYNLVKRTELLYKIQIRWTHMIAFIITAILLFFICYFILPYNIYNYLVAIVFLLYTFSGLICRGFNKKGVYNVNEITNLSRFVKWQDVQAINIAYNEEEYFDVTFVSGIRSFEHRYSNDVEQVLLKVKSDLNI